MKRDYKKEFESGEVVITKDNIALYHEFISDDDLVVHKEAIHDVFYNRYDELKAIMKLDINLSNFLDIKALQNSGHFLNAYGSILVSGYWLKVHYFGVKDTLKPISEYIAEIKESAAYKEYIAKK